MIKKIQKYFSAKILAATVIFSILFVLSNNVNILPILIILMPFLILLFINLLLRSGYKEKIIMKTLKMPILFSILTIFISYIAFAIALRGGFILSNANFIYCLTQGLILGLLTLLILFFLRNKRKAVIIVGILLEVIIYIAVYIYTAILASV